MGLDGEASLYFERAFVETLGKLEVAFERAPL